MNAKKITEDRIIKRFKENIDKERSSEILNTISEIYLDHMSMYYFPGDMIAFYPAIKEVRSSTFITCDFSGGIIYPGSFYCYYRPFLENLVTGSCYVLRKRLRVETGYYDMLPTTISQLEELNDQLQNYQIYLNQKIDFSHLYTVTGGSLKLQKLKKR